MESTDIARVAFSGSIFITLDEDNTDPYIIDVLRRATRWERNTESDEAARRGATALWMLTGGYAHDPQAVPVERLGDILTWVETQDAWFVDMIRESQGTVAEAMIPEWEMGREEVREVASVMRQLIHNLGSGRSKMIVHVETPL